MSAGFHLGVVQSKPSIAPYRAPSRRRPDPGLTPPFSTAMPASPVRRCLSWPSAFPMCLGGVLVDAKPAPARMTHDHLAGPLGERDLADEPRFHPACPARVLGGHRGAERAGCALHRPQLPHQV